MAKATASREAVIGRSAKVRGRITGEGDLTVLGQVEGEVSLKGDLTVGEGGSITSNVDANTVTISGSLEGDVRASGVIRIEAGARVRGDMHGSSVAIEDGAEYTGQLDAQFDLPPELSGGSVGERDSRTITKRR
jgi:cytoskeletal protein CcmA (bactofilin family)